MAPKRTADDTARVSAALAEQLRSVLDRAVSEGPTVRNGVLLVEAPRLGFEWKGASGLADPGAGLEMLPDDQFRSASVGKMVCATAAMILVEEGKLDLDGCLGLYLPREVTSGLHVLDGRSRGEEITIRQLLGHASGLPNNFRIPDFQRLLIEEPNKRWEPVEVLAYVKEHADPLFAPGKGWHYTDAGYLLVGLVVEAVTNLPLHEVYRAKVFEPLGMNDTYMVFREEPRGGLPGRSPSHVFFGDVDYTQAESLSADWAGGGLVTTAEDLNRFVRAFAEGSVFGSPSAKQEMLRWVPTGERGVYYGLGVRRFVMGEIGSPGTGEVWGHTGSSKSFALYWPERETTICGTLNQDAAEGAWSESLPIAAVVPETIEILEEARAEASP